MKAIIDYFIGRSLLVNLLTVLILLVGSVSLYFLQKEIFPKVEFDVIIITTSYPGSSAEDVEKLVTISIERELKAVDDLKTINALSAEGSSIIYLEVEADAKLQEVLDDVKEAVNNVDDLPLDAKTPRIRSLNNRRRGVLKVALTGGEYDELRIVSKRLRDVLEQNRKLSNVELAGYEVDEIRVKVDPQKLKDFDLTLREVSSAIEERNLNLSAGKLESASGDIIVRTLSEFESLQDILNVVVRSNDAGKNVLLKDLATVTRGPSDDSILQRSQGERAIFLDIYIKESADIIRTTEQIKDSVDKFFKDGKGNKLNFRYTDDASFWVTRRLNILKNNGIQGMFLVLFCLMLFLNTRTSIVTSLGAPIAFMVSFITMTIMGVTLNMISMFALILVLGMLVDDSIIVAEQFYQRIEAGEDPKSAAKNAAYETLAPVTATVLTTIVAFGALFFMGGIMGKFLWSVPAVVIICLAASWFECFFILPSHLADFCKIDSKKHDSEKRWYVPILKIYRKQLGFFLKYPFLIVTAFFFLFVGSLVMAKHMRFELFPGDDVRTVYFQIKGKVGNPLSQTDKAVQKVEELFLKEIKKDEMDQVRGQVGVLVGDHGNKTGAHYGSIILNITDPADRVRSTDEIVTTLSEKVEALLPDYVLTVKKMQGGPPKGKAVEIELKSDSLDDLKSAAHKVDDILKQQEGITSTEIDFEEGKKQIVAIVNDAEARRLGLSSRTIALELRRALAGDPLTEIRESDEDIDIKVSLNDEAITNVSSLENLFVMNNTGHRIPLSKVVKFEEQPGAFVIRRFDRKRIISVSASIDQSKTAPLKVAKQMKEKVEEIVKNYKEMTFTFGGENKDTEESMGRLFKSFGLAILCIFFILVVMFTSILQPFVVMSAIPLGLIGVVIAFKLFGQSLSFMAMMGVVGLVGVVVNDSIVLVTFINKTREDFPEQDLLSSVLNASVSRFRPVMLTTFTTVAGLLPVAHATGGDPFVKPMAMSFAWGLMFATLVTLGFVPSLYMIYAKYFNWEFWKQKFSKA